MTLAGLTKSASAVGMGAVIAAATENPIVLLVVVGVPLAAVLATVIVVVLTSALSSDPQRQPNAYATLDRMICAIHRWQRPDEPPPAPRSRRVRR